MTKMNNIIFDLGNVLIDFKPYEYISSQIPEKQNADLIYEEIFKSDEWLAISRGVITEKDAINAICDRNIEQSQLIRSAMDRWYHILTPIEDTVNILIDLKNCGYKIYFLSNFQLLAYEELKERYNFFEYFDGGVFSFEEKILKPELGIYEKLIKTYKLNPCESIFIDDTLHNIEMAKKLGFEAILFSSAAGLREKLIGYNVLV